MPVPRVFVSSTFYDLKYIRENLRYFIRSLGYEPILSEQGAVFYDPKQHVQEAAVAEVENCQILVLVIGGRSGQPYQGDASRSITNAEYDRAIAAKTPVFALVDRDVYDQFRVYLENKGSDVADEIKYPSVDDVSIFGFIDQVQKQSINNALVPFSNFDDIQSYLRQQWASMLFNFLTKDSETSRVADTLDALAEMSEKIEFLNREVLNSVGDKAANASAILYDLAVGYEDASVVGIFDYLKPTPARILRNEDLDRYYASFDLRFVVEEDPDRGWISKYTPNIELELNANYASSERELYQSTRRRMLAVLEKYEVSLDEYLERVDERGETFESQDLNEGANEE